MTGTRTWATLAAAAALIAAVGVQTMRLANERSAHADTRTRHAQHIAALESAARAAVQAARAEEQRRYTALQEIATDAQKQLHQARADAAASAGAGHRLRQRIATLTTACSAAPGHPPATGASPATATPTDLLHRVQQRLDDAADAIAGYADDARIAGQACERAYGALGE